MKVRELIEVLQTFPPDATVKVRTTCPECSTDTVHINEVVRELLGRDEVVIINN